MMEANNQEMNVTEEMIQILKGKRMEAKTEQEKLLIQTIIGYSLAAVYGMEKEKMPA